MENRTPNPMRRVEDRGLKIEDRFARDAAILDPRSSSAFSDCRFKRLTSISF
jgi:hypothetical protein